MIPKSILDLEPGDWFFCASTPRYKFLFLGHTEGGWLHAARYNKDGKYEPPASYFKNDTKVMYLGKNIPQPESKNCYIIQTQVDSACDWQSQYRGSGFEHHDPACKAARDLSKTLTGKVRVYNITTGKTKVIYEDGWESYE